MGEYDLKPCPFCGGGSAVYRSYYMRPIKETRYGVQCSRCKASSGPGYENCNLAQKAWNIRAGEKNNENRQIV